MDATSRAVEGEMMDDLISRQAVKDWLLKWEGYIDKDTIARMQYRVIDIRPAKVEPVRRGKWLITPYTDYDDTYECSACGHGWVFVEGTPKENDANYCPNCGALMEV